MKAFKIISPALILTLICLIVAGLLSFTNLVTKEPIKIIAEETASNLRAQVLPQAKTFTSEEDYYIGLDDKNNTVGYVFTKSSKGYGGDVKVMIGISTDNAITGVAILEHGETPGLGANCTKNTFTDEFNQKINSDGFSVVKDGSGGNNGKIDAITGATITSNAVTAAVNSAVNDYLKINSD